MRRLVRGTSSQLRGDRFPGHCTSASAMKQRTWNHAFKKHAQEPEKASRRATGLALLLLPTTDVGNPPAKVHCALWTFDWSGQTVSMHRRACRREKRWRQERRLQHRCGLPLLQHDTTQGEASGRRSQTCCRSTFQTGEGQVAPGAGDSRFAQTNDPFNLNGMAPAACSRQVKPQSKTTVRKRRLAKMYRAMYRSKYRNRAYLSVYWRKPLVLL